MLCERETLLKQAVTQLKYRNRSNHQHQQHDHRQYHSSLTFVQQSGGTVYGFQTLAKLHPVSFSLWNTAVKLASLQSHSSSNYTARDDKSLRKTRTCRRWNSLLKTFPQDSRRSSNVEFSQSKPVQSWWNDLLLEGRLWMKLIILTSSCTVLWRNGLTCLHANAGLCTKQWFHSTDGI